MNQTKQEPATDPTPAPPRPAAPFAEQPTDTPTEARLQAAAACLAALGYHDLPHRSSLEDRTRGRDTIWHLAARTRTACELTGLPQSEAARLHILKITVDALVLAAAVRPDELPAYLEAITRAQRRGLFSLAHRYLAGPRSGQVPPPHTAPHPTQPE